MQSLLKGGDSGPEAQIAVMVLTGGDSGPGAPMARRGQIAGLAIGIKVLYPKKSSYSKISRLRS